MKDPEITKILKKLLEFDTQNSSKIKGGYTLPLLLYVKKRLENKGVKVVIQEYKVKTIIDGKKIVLGKRGNLLAKIDIKKPHILFQGHIDTVPDVSGFRPRIQKDIVAGRGAVDMKGPVAGLIRAFELLLEKKDELSFAPVLLLTSDEEAHHFAGIKKFLEKSSLLPSDVRFGICAEPSNLNIKTHLYGAMCFSAQMFGVQAHSSLDIKDNPIERSAFLLSDLIKLKAKIRKRVKNGFGGSVLNVGKIYGGEKVNQTPRVCGMDFAIRNSESTKIIEELLEKAVFSQLQKKDKVEKIFSYNPIIVKLSVANKKIIQKAFLESKVPLRFAPMIGFSEAFFLNKAGIPCIVFGPGKFELAHSPAEKEKIRIGQIQKFVDILINLCKTS